MEEATQCYFVHLCDQHIRPQCASQLVGCRNSGPKFFRVLPNSDRTYFGLKSSFCQRRPEYMLCTKFEVTSFKGCVNK